MQLQCDGINPSVYVYPYDCHLSVLRTSKYALGHPMYITLFLYVLNLEWNQVSIVIVYAYVVIPTKQLWTMQYITVTS